MSVLKSRQDLRSCSGPTHKRDWFLQGIRKPTSLQSYWIFCGTNFKNWSIFLKQKEKTFHLISKSREYAIGDTSCFNIWDTAYRRGWQNCDINGMDIIRERNNLFSLIINSGLDWVVSWVIALRKTNLWGLPIFYEFISRLWVTVCYPDSYKTPQQQNSTI